MLLPSDGSNGGDSRKSGQQPELCTAGRQGALCGAHVTVSTQVFLACIGNGSVWNTGVFGITRGIYFQYTAKKLCAHTRIQDKMTRFYKNKNLSAGVDIKISSILILLQIAQVSAVKSTYPNLHNSDQICLADFSPDFLR